MSLLHIVDIREIYLRILKPVYRKSPGTAEMDQWIKTFATKPDNQSSVPGIHMAVRKKALPQVVL